MAKKLKDKKMQAKQARNELQGFVAEVVELLDSGEEPRPDGKGLAVGLVAELVKVYAMDEGKLGATFRGFIVKLEDRTDPLRAKMNPDLYSALWPALNSLKEARRKYLEHVAEIEAHRVQNLKDAAGANPAGAGVLRVDTGPVGAGGISNEGRAP